MGCDFLFWGGSQFLALSLRTSFGSEFAPFQRGEDRVDIAELTEEGAEQKIAVTSITMLTGEAHCLIGLLELADTYSSPAAP